LPAGRRSAIAGESAEYQRAYTAAYERKVRSRRNTATWIGVGVATVTLAVLGSRFDSHRDYY